MVKSIQYRKKSILKDMIDKIEWRQRDMLLYSKGHTLGALLQNLDLYVLSGPENISILGLTQRLGTFLALDVELQIWYWQLLQEFPSPLYWPTTSEGNDTAAFSFRSLQLAHLMLDYWALGLIVSVTIATLCQQIPHQERPVENGSRSPANSARSEADESSDESRDVLSFVHRAKVDHNGARHMELALRIMESVPFCMDTEHGLSSSQKCLFGARVAMFLLERHPPKKFATYQAIYNALSINKGLNFAKGIGSTLQRWETKV